MSVPSFQNTILDNQLGIRAPSGTVLALIASAKSGALNTPANFTKTKDVVTEFTSGPLVELAAYAIERHGLTVKCIRSAATTAGAYEAIDVTDVTGTCDVQVNPALVPLDDLEAIFTCTTGATIGVTGGAYTYSLDGGATTHGPYPIGTAFSVGLDSSNSGVGLLLEPPVGGLVASATEARADCLAHLANVVAHDAADTSSAQVALAASAIPTTNAQAIAIFVLIDAAYTAHRADVAAHNSADTTSLVGVTAPTTGQAAITYFTALKTAWATHLANVVAHNSADVTNTIAAAVPVRGTLVAADVATVDTTAPQWDAGDLDDSLEVLRVHALPWTVLGIYGACDSSALSTIDAKMEAMATAGRNRRLVAHVRVPDAGEAEATYLASLLSAHSADAVYRAVVCAGAANIDSSIGKRRRYRRSPMLAIAPLLCSVSEEIDIAELAYRLPGVYIKDANGNPDEHDETINPGLDDARFCVLRSWEGKTGVYVNNPRLFSPVDSDFLYAQHGRVIDVACTIVRNELLPLLSRGFTAKTDGSGQISDSDAESIDAKVNSALAKALVGTRKCSAAVFAISRTDNVLTTGSISWETRVVPLVYIKNFTGSTALVASDKAPATLLG